MLDEFFASIADRIVADLAPARVLDAGCAMGLLVRALRDRGVEADGIDVSEYAISKVPAQVAPYCRVGSIADPFPQRYDLIVNIEVVEHMPPREADRAITNLAAHTDAVLFSSSPFDLREPTHQSVRPPEAWAEAFAREGLYRDVEHDAGYVTAWAVLFRREALPQTALIRRYERWAFARDFAAREARAHAIEVQQQLPRLDALEALMPELDALRAKAADMEAGRELLKGCEDRVAGLVAEVQSLTLARDLAVGARDQALSGRDLALGERDQALGERDQALNACNQATSARDHAVSARDQALGEYAQALNEAARAREIIRAMESSVFWKLRKLLRRP
jgi:SAM-dependent methyltransferase